MLALTAPPKVETVASNTDQPCTSAQAALMGQNFTGSSLIPSEDPPVDRAPSPY